MRFLFSSLVLLSVAFQSSSSYVECQQHITCTNGRIFMTDQQQNILHALDTDDGEIYDVDVVGASPRLLVTESGLIVSSYAGTSATDGVTQFFHPGLIIENHEDHWDVHKELPFSYPYQITNIGSNIELTSNNNYIGIFYGSNDITIPSTAKFVKQDEIATSATPTTVSVTPKDANQQILPSASTGIAVALSSTRFLVSVADGFSVVDQNGIEVFNLHNTSNPDGHCLNYKKTSINNNEYISICGTNVFTIIYHATTDVVQTKTQIINLNSITSNAINSQFIGYQPSTSTLYRFAANMDETLVVPSTQMYTYDATTLPSSQPCGVFYENSDHHHGIVFWPTGRLDVIIPSPLELEHSFQIGSFNGEQSVCDTLSFTFGHGIVYVADRVNQIIYTINIENEDGMIPNTTLSFVPANIALYYDERAECVDGGNEHQHDHDNDHDHDHDHNINASTATTALIAGNDTTGTTAPPQCVMVCTCQPPSTSSIPTNSNININAASSAVSSSIMGAVALFMTSIALI